MDLFSIAQVFYSVLIAFLTNMVFLSKIKYQTKMKKIYILGLTINNLEYFLVNIHNVGKESEQF